jgi:hypothetical protein
MTRLAFVTLGTHDYAPQSRVLARSIRRFHPDARLILFAVENSPHPELYGDAFDEIITCNQLGVPTLADMAFRYSQAEFCFALKPWMLSHLLRRRAYDAITYLDCDIELFSPLRESVSAIAGGADLVLTPHHTVPARATDHVMEETVLKSGAFNAGFLAVSARRSAEQFIAWWAEKTQADAGVDANRGTYGDQKWLDLAPSFVERAMILRHPGYNVAYWNSHLRSMAATAKGWSCAGEPLRFFHYSRWGVAKQSAEDYLQAFFPAGSAFLLPLLQDYAGKIRAEPVTPKEACSALATFTLPGGAIIPGIVKSAYMQHVASTVDSRKRIVEHSLEVLNAPSKAWPQRDGQPVTVLFDWIWHAQPEDWRREHDLTGTAGWERFASWLRGGGAAFYALPPAYLGPLAEAEGASMLESVPAASPKKRLNPFSRKKPQRPLPPRLEKLRISLEALKPDKARAALDDATAALTDLQKRLDALLSVRSSD